MDSMFWICESLQTLDIRNFDFTNVETYFGMFTTVPSTCTIYVNQAGYDFISAHQSDMELDDLSMLQVVSN
jgi:hypothetical protein